MDKVLKKESLGVRLMSVLKDWSIELIYIIPGAIGAFLVALKKPNRKRPWWEKLIIIFIGTATANFLTPLVLWVFNMPYSVHGGIAFLLGYLGLEAVAKIIDTYRDKVKKK